MSWPCSESVREGIVAIDRNNKITMMNKAAIRILDLPQEDVHRKDIMEVLPDSRMPEVLQSGEHQLDRESTLSGKEIIVNRVPIKLGEKVVGVVSSFRPKSEIDQLVSELSQARRYADVLRAQTHEFHNLLYTISGLLQLGSIQEAVELITSETSAQQEMILFLAKQIPDPLIGALLLGMHNRAKELKIQFQINQDSRLKELPPTINRQQVVVLLGTLIQNALEAVNESGAKQRVVECYLADTGEEILFEVEDSGPGVQEELRERIFQHGFSTKPGEDRGLGLAKAKGIIQEMNGYILVGKSEWGGAEQGIDASFNIWRGVFGPADMPADAKAYWEAKLKELNDSEAWKKELAANGWESEYKDSAAFPSFLDEQDKLVKELLTSLGMAK